MKKQYTKLVLLTILYFIFIGMNVDGQNQNQLIGSFPNMQGGYENQNLGLLTAGVSPGGNVTAWNCKGSTVGGSIVSSSPRTGSKYETYNTAIGTGKYCICPYGSPGTALSPSTSYVIQYYFRNALTTGSTSISYQFLLSIDGGTTTATSTVQAFASTNNLWVKGIAVISTGAQVASNSYAGFKTNTTVTNTAVDFDDFVVYAGATADITPPDAPTAPAATTTVATQMAVSWTDPVIGAGNGVDGGGYMVVRYTADPTGQPDPNVNGIYAMGNSVGSGTVAYIGTNPSFTDLGLTPSTHYYYRIYSVDKAFNYSTSIVADFSTTAPNYAAEPVTQATNVTFSGITQTGLTVNWTAGDGTNNLVLIKAGSAVNADPADGNTYAASTVFGSGAALGTGNYVVYNGTGTTATITGLIKATTYYVKVYSFNGSGGTENYLITSPAAGNQLASPGEIVSNGSSGAGVSWNTAGAWVGGVIPTASDNVTLVSPDKLNVASSQSCYNLTVQSGAKVYNNTAMPSSSLQYLTIYGTSITCDGILGDKSETTPAADGALGINFANNLTISGSGTIRPCRIRPVTLLSNLTLTFNANVQMTYPGGTGTGGSSIYTDNVGNDNITITVNPLMTLSFVDYSNLSMTSSSSTNGSASTTINVNGTITMPVHSYLSIPVLTGKTAVLNVNGTLNAGNLNATSAAGGALPTINVGNAGTIAVSGTADFSSSTLSANVTGTGTFTLNPGSSINIASITGLEPVAGPVQTSTRNFDQAANYSFVGTAAQVTGSDLPAVVNALTIKNVTGVSLSAPLTSTSGLTLTSGALINSTNNVTLGNGATVILTDGSLSTIPNFGSTVNLIYNSLLAQTTSVEVPSTSGILNNLTLNNGAGVSLGSNATVNGVLTMTAGKLSLGANNLTIGATGSVSGATTTNYIVTNGAGSLIQPIAAGGTVVFPIGASLTSYDPVSINPTSATNFSASVSGTLSGTAPSGYNYNAKEWNLSSDAPSSTVVTFTPSAVTATGANPVIGQYDGSNYNNIVASLTGNAYSGTFTSFSQFVTGATDLGTSVSENFIKGVSFDGQIIHNKSNIDLQLFDIKGRLIFSSSKDINMGSYINGVYLVKSATGTLKITLK